uniref:Uncharacterized protein n=1 Tax=viral metagenome TaxID=1070528 RepID=A0A6C0JV67_9ZZZZ
MYNSTGTLRPQSSSLPAEGVTRPSMPTRPSTFGTSVRKLPSRGTMYPSTPSALKSRGSMIAPASKPSRSTRTRSLSLGSFKAGNLDNEAPSLTVRDDSEYPEDIEIVSLYDENEYQDFPGQSVKSNVSNSTMSPTRASMNGGSMGSNRTMSPTRASMNGGSMGSNRTMSNGTMSPTRASMNGGSMGSNRTMSNGTMSPTRASMSGSSYTNTMNSGSMSPMSNGTMTNNGTMSPTRASMNSGSMSPMTNGTMTNGTMTNSRSMQSRILKPAQTFAKSMGISQATSSIVGATGIAGALPFGIVPIGIATGLGAASHKASSSLKHTFGSSDFVSQIPTHACSEYNKCQRKECSLYCRYSLPQAYDLMYDVCDCPKMDIIRIKVVDELGGEHCLLVHRREPISSIILFLCSRLSRAGHMCMPTHKKGNMYQKSLHKHLHHCAEDLFEDNDGSMRSCIYLHSFTDALYHKIKHYM